ncbi:MAG: response regulator [Candidatus Tectomicrobia bacterium]|uniref:Response regulator n=1 Tax=Tectimicrobiota bacterium TaxID=2528274 RepID=A0A932CR39_UNCTE|nr:response regulator [Candidatus Tectomicrobia bacterium]
MEGTEQLHILIVDDNPAIAEALQEALHQKGYRTTVAHNGCDGLVELRKGNFDAVLSDIRMPEMDGITLLGWIQEYDPLLPVIILTGFPDLDIAVKAMREGAADFIPKPFTLEQIEHSLEKLLKERKMLELDPQLLRGSDSRRMIEYLNRKLDKKVKELSKLYAISEALNLMEDKEALFQKLVELAAEIAEARKAILLILDRGTQRLEIKAALGFAHKDLKALPIFSTGSHFLGKSVLEGKPLLFESAQGEGLGGLFPGAWLLLPIKIRQEVIGALAVAEKIEGDGFSQEEVFLLATLANKASLTLENIALYESIYSNLLDTLRALVNTLEAKDHYTREHSQRVTQWAVEIAQEMGCSLEEIETLKFAGFLHDIGKIGISDAILGKPDQLTAEEFSTIKFHPLIGEKIIAPLGLLPPEREIIRHHHERWDGTGYPDGLAREEIPLLARILAVADAFDAMTSDRPYRKARSFCDSLLELERAGGTQFDHQVVMAFKRVLLAKYPDLFLDIP